MKKITKQTFQNGVPYAFGINKNDQLEVIFRQRVINMAGSDFSSFRYATAVLTNNEEIPIHLKRAKSTSKELKLPSGYTLLNSKTIDSEMIARINNMVGEIKGYDDDELDRAYDQKDRTKDLNSPNDLKKPLFNNPFSFYNKIYRFSRLNHVLVNNEGIPVGITFERRQLAIDRDEKGLAYMQNGHIKFTKPISESVFNKKILINYKLKELHIFAFQNKFQIDFSNHSVINKGTEDFLKK